MMKSRARPAADRFWEKVDKGLFCWEWTASVNPMGYGQFNFSRRGRCVLAHRFAYELLVGPIPDGLCVLHHCDNPRYVRPDHLFLGTRTDNSLDKVRKRRQSTARGERSNTAKLTASKVIEIRGRFAAGETNKSALAREYGVGHTAIRSILSRKNWRHLP